MQSDAGLAKCNLNMIKRNEDDHQAIQDRHVLDVFEALIVGENENDIGAFRFSKRSSGAGKPECRQHRSQAMLRAIFI